MRQEKKEKPETGGNVMGLFDIFKKKKVQKEETKYPEYLYSERELDE